MIGLIDTSLRFRLLRGALGRAHTLLVEQQVLARLYLVLCHMRIGDQIEANLH
jgi:hypothetical protein